MTILWIVGAGGHAAVVADAARSTGAWSGVAFFDDLWPEMRSADGCEVLGNLDMLRRMVSASGWPTGQQAVVGIGHNATRLGLSREVLDLGGTLATVVHTTAVISPSARLGAGSVVFAKAVVNPHSRLGLGCIVNTGAIVDHDVAIDDGVHICPGVALAGNVTVGELATIGIGTCVIQGIRIGQRATVGAGTTVIRDVEAETTVAGNPARRI